MGRRPRIIAFAGTLEPTPYLAHFLKYGRSALPLGESEACFRLEPDRSTALPCEGHTTYTKV
jgi:hypothetical protein